MTTDANLLKLWQAYADADQEWADVADRRDAGEDVDEALFEEIVIKLHKTKDQIAEAEAASVVGLAVQFRIVQQLLVSEGGPEAVIGTKMLRWFEQMAGLDAMAGLAD